jgi:hypothetical protein
LLPPLENACRQKTRLSARQTLIDKKEYPRTSYCPLIVPRLVTGFGGSAALTNQLHSACPPHRA